ncbi:hypothetical protein JOF29_001680 [Kribbella aluminosa]|uniref:Uncharacterized protein n=1 Tax=Kribbella aluminosa TaxID=416017 RepID=A0ABS4UG26_9ACTN|nr:hypothetical protein [Kribbella aluminosa]MBP2350597.1 hypothetical protein [Kribbella aluminosa]
MTANVIAPIIRFDPDRTNWVSAPAAMIPPSTSGNAPAARAGAARVVLRQRHDVGDQRPAVRVHPPGELREDLRDGGPGRRRGQYFGLRRVEHDRAVRVPVLDPLHGRLPIRYGGELEAARDRLVERGPHLRDRGRRAGHGERDVTRLGPGGRPGERDQEHREDRGQQHDDGDQGRPATGGRVRFGGHGGTLPRTTLRLKPNDRSL